MDQEAKYWRDKWKDATRIIIQLKQELLDCQDGRKALDADRETIKRLKDKKKPK